jgi:WD40 repeat protein
MSELGVSLIEKPKDFKNSDVLAVDKAVTLSLNKPQDQSELRGCFNNIKSSVIDSFSFKTVTLPFESTTIKISTKHSLLLGTKGESKKIALVDLKSPDAKAKLIKIDHETVTCIRFSPDEDLIFLGTMDGFILKYDFPSFTNLKTYDLTDNDTQEYAIQFDYHSNGYLYAAHYENWRIRRINIETAEVEVIGRLEGITYIRVNSQETHVAVCNDEVVKVYSRDRKWLEFSYKLKNEDDENENEYKCEIEFSTSGTLFGISYGNTIKIWNISENYGETLKDTKKEKKYKSFTLNTNKDISSFKFNSDDTFIVAVGVDQSINIWDINSETQTPKFMNQPIDYYQNDEYELEFDLELDEDKNLIYTHERYSDKSHIWKGIFLDKAAFPKSSFCKENQRILNQKNGNRVIVTDPENNRIVVWSIDDLAFVREIKLDSIPYDITFNGESQELLYIGSEGVIYVLETTEYSIVESISSGSSGKIYAISSTPLYIISGGSSKSLAIQGRAGGFNHYINVHDSEISVIKSNDAFVVSGDESGDIYVHIIDNWLLHAHFTSHKQSVKYIEFINNGEEIITISHDKKCIFWSLNEKVKLKDHELEEEADSSVLSKDQKSFILSTNTGNVHVYNLPSFKLINTLHYKSTCNQRLILDSNENYLIVSNDEGIFRTKSPVSPENPTIISQNINIPELIIFLKDIKKGSDEKNNNWIIAPFMVNSMHYYSFENLKTQLRKAFMSKSDYLNSVAGTPLDISLKKGNIEATGVIISHLKLRVKEDKFALETLSDCIIDLNKGGFKGLDELYTDSLVICSQDDLPESTTGDIKLPQIKYGLTAVIDPLTFGVSKESLGEKKITFLISTIRLNLELGSSESIEFLESLLECSNTEIFKTKFIQTILNDKWNRLKWILIFNGFLYAVYLLSLSYYIMYEDFAVLNVSLVSNIILFFYEVLQVSLDPAEYIKGLWNYIDITRAALFYAYYIFTSLNSSSDTYLADQSVPIELNIILLLLTIISWVRGITLFTIYSETRYMIGLLGEVLKDIVPFALVVLYSVAAFSFITLSSNKISSPGEPIETGQFLQSYFDAIGSFEGSTEYTFKSFLIVLATVFNCIIMMNLLISILGTTYGRVNDDSLVEGLKQLTNLIIEAESVLFLRKGRKKRTFLHICEEYNPPEVAADDIRLRFKTVNAELAEIKKTHISNHSKNEETLKGIIAKQEDTISKLKTTKEELTAVFKNTTEELQKQILEVLKKESANKKPEEEEKNQNKKIFRCLNDHELKGNFTDEPRACDICRSYIQNTYVYQCNICNFDLCLECADFYFEHLKDNKTDFKCYLGHVLLHFDDINQFYNERKYEISNCRECNLDFSIEESAKEAFHCIVCLYSVCKSCTDIYAKAIASKEKKKCTKPHELVWKHKELYLDRNSLIITCSKCNKDINGAGFYTCECPRHLCLNCVNTDYLGAPKEKAAGEEHSEDDEENSEEGEENSEEGEENAEESEEKPEEGEEKPEEGEEKPEEGEKNSEEAEESSDEAED